MADLPAFPHFLNPKKKPSTLTPKTQTQQPIVTGSSILGIKYNGGVMLASDTLASYGSLARFRSAERVKQFGDYTVVGASGEYSDWQYIQNVLQHHIDKDYQLDDGNYLTPKEIHQWLVRVMYNRRNQFDPLWNTLVVAGFRDGKAFLGQVDSVGTHFEDNTISTGFGSYLAQPILRSFFAEKGSADNISEQEARKVLEQCMRVLFYRDARTSDKIQIASVNAQGVKITEPFVLDTQWTFKGF
jgi:20S proteasome subunit beta 7